MAVAATVQARRRGAGAELHQALALHRAGRLAEAEAAYQAVLADEPAHAEAWRLLGLARLARGAAADAAECLERSVRLRPASAEAHLALGNALAAQGKLSAALTAYERACSLAPDHLEVLNNLANCLNALRRSAEAVPLLERALALAPQVAELHNNLGHAWQALGRADDAMAAFRAALARRPDFPEALSNLGNVLKARNELVEAEACYRRAVEIRPDYVDALNHLGNVLVAQGRVAEAIAIYQRSGDVQPAQGHAFFYEALAHLTLGDFARGFALYEHRWRSELRGAQREFPQPLWRGDADLRGRALLLHAEQGLGDTIQFARYAALAAARGARVVLEVQPALRGLLSSVPGAAVVCARGEALPEFDLHCPLLSLPLAFGTVLADVPAAVPYLTAPVERVARWRQRLPRRAHRRIGLVWSGNPHHKNDHNRSVPLAALRPVLAAAGAEFFSLQVEYRSAAERAEAAALGIVDLADEIADFADTAALAAEMDLVISVDTSVAHLAGALARPVWLLLPFAPDWRWLRERADSPWYPTMRLFRQRRTGDWTKPVAEIAAALREEVER